MTFFSDETVEQLVDAAATVKARAYDLIGAFLSHDYASDPAREHAHHGFSRRVSMLSHCIRRVFRDLPPDLDGLPDESVVIDATINIQAFVFNAFGALDNLAWIWVSERGIKRADGRELDRTQIGLTDKYATVRASFSQPTQDYLATIGPWFAHLVDFRDALAHRIPLYIPRHSVGEANQAEYAAMGQQLWAAHGDEYERIKADQLALAVFLPVMKHSFADPKPPVVFHCQLLADFATIEEIDKKIIVELRAAAPPALGVIS